MSGLYQQQRERLIAMSTAFLPLLPEELPPSPPPVPATSTRERYELLREAANTHAQLAIIVGWGDGSLVRQILGDPLLSKKELWFLLLRGEEESFAWSLREPLCDALESSGAAVAYLHGESDLETAVMMRFGAHGRIPPLAGMDQIDQHPLAPAAQELRARMLPELARALSDRPQTYGNDISDTFTGLHQASANASRLLRAPTLDDLAGCFGDAPIISLAAGPSLKRHIPRLRELQDRCILVCCDAVLHGLLDEGIVPHICTPLERVGNLPMMTRAPECRTFFAGIPVVQSEVVDQFADRLTCIYGMDDLYRWLDPEHRHAVATGSSTGVLSLAVASALSTGPVYLVGHDLARDESGSHWGGAAFAGSDWMKIKDETKANRAIGGFTGFEDRFLPGNDGGTVPSIAWWDRFRQEIAQQALRMSRLGRPVYNVNAHDRVYAVIPHTQAAPLPDPASLPRIAWPTLPAGDPGRYQRWAARASHLETDAKRFVEHVRGLQREIEAMKRRPPGVWQPTAIADRLSTHAGVSEGNRQAFSYFLRSALHNTTAVYHQRRRTASPAQRDWHSLSAMGELCDALGNAVSVLTPKIQEIAGKFSHD